MTKTPIRLAIVGVGNCASSLVQAIAHCHAHGPDAIGVSYRDAGGYYPEDIEVVAAFDVDRRKVGRPLGEAIQAAPNCTAVFHDPGADGCEVMQGPALDGIATNMGNAPTDRAFRPAAPEAALDQAGTVAALKAARAEVMMLFLPVGAVDAAAFYADCALEAGCALVNGFPVFLASDKSWSDRFAARGLPILGDDIKAQFGATIVHRTLMALAEARGVEVDRSYQLNVGGNTDFLNMREETRLYMKRESKTEAVQTARRVRMPDDALRVGPSDYVPWLQDRKVAFVRLEGRLLGGVATNIEVRLEVEDSPNAAAEALVAIRCARIALDRGLSGAISAACGYLFKHPPVAWPDEDARAALEAFMDPAGSK